MACTASQLALVGIVFVAGCSRPAEDKVQLSSDLLDRVAARRPAAPPKSEAPAAEAVQAVFDEPATVAGDEREAALLVALAEEESDPSVILRRQLVRFIRSARSAAEMLSKHCRTDEFEEQCDELTALFDHLSEIPADDARGERAAAQAQQILLALKLGRFYLQQRDEMEMLGSPRARQMLHDIHAACRNLAREETQALLALERRIDGR